MTIDIDKDDVFGVHRIRAIGILWMYGYRNITLRISPSGKHHHIIAWHRTGHTIEKHLEIRDQAGDDKARIYFDEKKNRTINILFSEKKVIIFSKKNRNKIRKVMNQ